MSSSLPSPLVLRPYGAAEWPAVFRLVGRAFLGDPDDATQREAEGDLMEFDRAQAVFDGDLPVGSIAVFSLAMTLPGGIRPVAGVSQVGVAGTHRRRGILRSMMTATLEQLADGGEPVAALWASEPAIYGRFGFGMACPQVHAVLPRGAALTAGTPPPAGELRLVELPARIDVLAAVHAGVVARRTGDMVRTDALWRHRVLDLPSDRSGASPLHAVVHCTDGTDDGYALVQLKSAWGPSGPAGEVDVREVVAADPVAELTLWRYLLDVDLTTKVAARSLAPDAPVLAALVNPRTADLKLGDNLYVRIVDVARALLERTYSTDVDLVLQVHDSVLPANDGCWRLRPGTCERVQQPADLELDVRELGAVHLGGTGWGTLHRAGLITEHTAGAVAAAGAAWALPADLASPVCPMVF